MIKILSLLITLFINIHVIAQNSPSDFLNNKCSYETDGTGKALGLKIKLAYPCSWTQANGDRPHVVQKFSYSFGNGYSLIQTMTINQMPNTPTQQEVSEMFSEQGLKDLAKSVGTYVSGRKVKIDGINCGEVVLKMKRESPAATVNMYLIGYYLIYKDKLINISYMAGGPDETDTKTLFTKYKLLFQTLATNTVLLSKWE